MGWVKERFIDTMSSAMVINLFCNPSQALFTRMKQGKVIVDGIEFSPFQSPRQILALKKAYPSVPFQYHASNLFRSPFAKRQMRLAHAVCSESRWVSLHLSPLPSWAIYPALKFKINFTLFLASDRVKPFIRRVNHLQQNIKLPIILENMPVLPQLKTLIESDPETITRVIQATGCDLLLDLAHARIAAFYRGMEVREYLRELPLDRTRQIHISGVRVENQVLFDAHEPLQEEDYDLLSWVLEFTKPEIVTLEYYRENDGALDQMLCRLRRLLQG